MYSYADAAFFKQCGAESYHTGIYKCIKVENKRSIFRLKQYSMHAQTLFHAEEWITEWKR